VWVTSAPVTWWRDGVIYQIYPRSYRDSNGDGVGDLAGIAERLDHLAWLGVDAIWITPITPSPDSDWGYDVAFYTGVQPVLGDLEGFDRLVADADARGIKVVLDLVPNHTSSKHRWFREARASKSSPRRDWYVWADPRPGGSPPNNWRSSFGGPAWTMDPVSRQYYLHNFLPTQPDLNWWSEEVREEFDQILRFWFDRGVAGFRIDVAHAIVKDKELRDNPPAEPGDHPYVTAFGQRKVYNAERPEAHDVLRRWRALAEEYEPPRLLLGETYVLDVERLRPFYGDGDELQLAFNFVFLHSPFTAEGLRSIVDATERTLDGPDAWPVWAISTHDLPRYVDRWAGGSADRARCALLMLLTLRGTPVLYYGDELGMADVPVPREQRRDPVGTGAFDASPGRDPCRTPMPWSAEPGGGFTTPEARPWLPLSAQPGVTVEEQRADPDSMLVLCRDLIALRRAEPDLSGGGYESLATPDGLWAFRRGGRFVVALNLSDTAGAVDLPSAGGRIRIATRRERDGEAVDGPLTLGPWEAAVVELGG
jgi:alpha-glucosidase